MIPAAVAVKFPGFDVSFPDGRSAKLPILEDGNEAPKVTMLCLSFRASSQVHSFAEFFVFFVCALIVANWQ